MIEADSELFSVYGYIAPDGLFYACWHKQKSELLSQLKCAEKQLVEIKEMFGAPFIIVPDNVTSEQIDTLYAWCLKHNHDFPKDEVELKKDTV